jgi:hypothetical protein
MTQELLTATPNDSIAECMRVMNRKTCSTSAGSGGNQDDDRNRFDRRRAKMVLPAQAAAMTTSNDVRAYNKGSPFGQS